MRKRIVKLVDRVADSSLRDIGIWVLVQARWICILTVGLVAWADLVSADLRTFSGFWTSIKDDWIWFVLTIVATGYVIWDPGIRLSIRRQRISNQKERVNYAVLGLDELSKLIRVRSRSIDDYHSHFSKAIEPLLLAAEFELRVTLSIPERIDTKVNLLILKEDRTIEVCGRSRPGSPVPAEYEIIDSYPAAVAMKNNKTTVMKNFSNGEAIKRPYRSVAATPIAVGDCAYGVLTIDSPEPDLFDDKTEEIDRVFRFYTSLFTLTLPNDSIHWKCPSRYSR